MKKRIILIISLLILSLCFVACGKKVQEQKPDGDQGGGTEHEDLMDISGVEFKPVTVDYDGKEHEILISGNLPEGVTVEYNNNKQTDAGEYKATAKISGKKYKTLEMEALLTINKIDIQGINFENFTCDYDGKEHELLVSGSLPEGVTVEYNNNKQTDAGEYKATAKISGKNYNTLNLEAVLNINKLEITGITIADAKLKHDGLSHKPEIAGTVPQGVAIKYFFDEVESNGVSALGKYNVRVELSGKNYKTLILNCVFKITPDYVELAKTVINSFASVPDVWSFLPESFDIKTRMINGAIPDYQNFVNVSDIPLNGMGKQLNLVYGILNTTSTALKYVNEVYKVMNVIKDAYTTFLDSDPENYKEFNGNAGAFGFSIQLTETQYLLSANVKKVGIVIYSDTNKKEYGARVQLTDTTVLKYTVTDNQLVIGINILNVSATQITFVREEQAIAGYIYEYLCAGDKQLVCSSSMMHSDADFTTFLGTHGDFIPGSKGVNCEVYRNSDGMYVGGEVREDLKDISYNTLWYRLADVTGIRNIRKVDEQNGSNAKTIYINDSTEAIHTKLMGISYGKKVASRRYDIEFKKMYFVTYDEVNDKYEDVVIETPILFVQEEVIDTFTKDFQDKNGKYLAAGEEAKITASQEIVEAVRYTYHEVLTVYDKIKESVTYDNIVEYCGR